MCQKFENGCPICSQQRKDILDVHSCISYLCIIVPRCWQIRHPQVSHVSYCARLTRSCSIVRFALWLRAPRLSMVLACRDPCLPVLFSMLLSDPSPIVVLVINGLGHRAPRTCEKFSRFICSDPAQEPWVDYARTTNHSTIISRAWPGLAIGTTT